jgi:(2R)-3-sulfolactate dehydrogenase (NADP+)
MSNVAISVAEAHRLAVLALTNAGVAEPAATATAEALVAAERDGLSSHGLARLPFYVAQVRTGKIRANAQLIVQENGAVVQVDADHGLAFAALAAGSVAAAEVARKLGIAALSITRSHHFGVAGYPVEALARQGLIAIAFSNSPAAMAPWGGHRALYGTNPIAFAAPRVNGADPLVIDLSLSHVARGKVMLAQKSGQPIPGDWALDAEGRPTTDAAAAMAGTMLPVGGAKGAALGLMVELLTAGLAGANFGYEASSLFDAEGAPPGLAHLILVLDPAHFAGDFTARAEALFEQIAAQEGARLPGSRRLAARAANSEKLTLPETLRDELTALAEAPPDQPIHSITQRERTS